MESQHQPEAPTGRARVGTGVTGSVLAVVVLAVVVLSGAGCSPWASDPWPATVISVDEGTVCTEQLGDGDHPGGERPCLNAESSEVPLADLQVGDCVNLNVHHPSLVLESKIDCPPR